MYEKYFSFKHKPFELIPNPDFLFLSNTHKKAITYLEYGIKEKIGFILLTGEIGSGKTTIIRNLIKNIDGSVKLARINNTKVSSEQLISMINEDFGLEVEGKSKTKLLSELNLFLIEQYSKQVQPILLIDEAQNLSPDLLEEIRLLSNLETDRAKLLQIILVGQPELKKTLLLPRLMQLRQRININYHLSQLTISETAEYIRHRLSVAGNPHAITFKDDMLEVIYKFSRGIPRLINIVCDFALLSTFVEEKKEVTADIMREIVQDLESRNYWDDARGSEAAETDRIHEDPGIIKTLGEISLRIIKLEEQIAGKMPEIKSLTEKVSLLEEAILDMNGNRKSNNLVELIDRISALEQIHEVTNIDTKDNNVTADGKNDYRDELCRIGQQVESLSDIVNYLNKKIRN